MAGKSFTIGGVGASGGHEFLFFDKYQQRTLIKEAVLEALVVGGLPIKDISDREKSRLADIIYCSINKYPTSS